MAERPEPYVRRDPGDVIRSGDWNELQVQTREEVYNHRHTGAGDGLKIPRGGIEPKAIDGSLIDPVAEYVMKKLTLSESLTVDAKTAMKSLTVSGELKVDSQSSMANLDITGKLGIGTNNPVDSLTVTGGDIRIEGGKYRRLKIISDEYWAGIELVARNKGEAGRPHIDFTHGEMDNPNYGIRLSAPSNDALSIEGGKLGIGTANPKYQLEVIGDVRAQDGLVVDGNRTTHLDKDGAFYRFKGQVYITVDDNLYIRDSRGAIKMHFDTNGGVFKTNVLRLGDKWRLSAVGDAHQNDDWLRLFDVNNKGYHGGFAAGRLWTSQKRLAGSDIRMKKNIASIGDTLDKLTKIQAVGFQWKKGEDGACIEIGLIAQEVEKIFPELVEVGPDEMKGIKYDGFIPLLIEAIKEQQKQIKSLQDKLYSS